MTISKYPKAYIYLVTILIVILGAVRFQSHLPYEKTEDSYYSGSVESVKSGEKLTRCVVFLNDGKRILLNVFEENASISIGSNVTFHSELQTIQRPSSILGFSWKKYWGNQGVFFQANVKLNNINVRKHSFSVFSNYRKQFKKYLKDHLATNTSGFILALTVGDKTTIDQRIKSKLGESGLSHLLAISGLHIGIIYFVVVFLLDLLISNKYRVVKSFVVLCVMAIYWLLCENSVSINRAMLMLLLLEGSTLLNRKYNPLNALYVAAFICLLVNPLCYLQVGFQLSFWAVYCIIQFAIPLMKRFQVNNKVIKYFLDLMIVSGVVQIGLTPLLLYHFGEIQLMSIIGNLFFVPFTTVFLCLSFILLMMFKLGSWVNFLVFLIEKLFECYELLLDFLLSVSCMVKLEVSLMALPFLILTLIVVKESSFARLLQKMTFFVIVLISLSFAHKHYRYTINEEQGEVVFRDYNDDVILNSKVFKASELFENRTVADTVFVDSEVALRFFKLKQMKFVLLSSKLPYRYKLAIRKTIGDNVKVYDFKKEGYKIEW